jgi:hypothetical protein
MSFNFEKAAQAMDRAAAAGSLQEEQAAVFDALRYKEEIQIALCNRALARCGGPLPLTTRLPIKDENGEDCARVEARVPKLLYHGLRNQKNFGEDGFTDDSGMKDFLKSYPQCRVKTVTGKTTVGYTGKSQNQPAAIFGRGTLELAT